MIKEQLKTDLISAMKNKEALKVSTLRYLLSKIAEKEIENRPKQIQVSDEDVLVIIKKLIKQRGQSIEGYEQVGNLDMVKKESDEREILQTYYNKYSESK